jgi:hypothetical protein
MKARAVLMRVNTPEKKDFDPKIALSLVAKLGGLAGVRNDKAFEEGLIFAMWSAHEAVSIGPSNPRGPLIKGAEKIGQAAFILHRLLSSQDPVGRRAAEVVFIEVASRGDSQCTNIANCLSAISGAVGSLKRSYLMPRDTLRGRPRGRPGSGSSLDDFIHYLELAALRAGGNWKLNKNDQRGTLIDAIELLRPYLPEVLVPDRGKHPYSSYQSALTSARRGWKKYGHNFDMIIRNLVDAKSGKSLIFRPLDG